MAPYKTQHFLPTGYLRYFSDDQKSCTAQSFVWRFDGNVLRRVPVRSQGADDYFYSKEKAEEVEKSFHKREGAYCQFVDEIRSDLMPTPTSFGDLFLSMADLSLRNRIHANSTGEEGYVAYGMRVDLFFAKMLLGNGGKVYSEESVKRHLTEYWRMELISAPSGFEFVTSDHPSLFCTCSDRITAASSPLQMILIALDPLHIAVAFDNRYVSVTQKSAVAKDVSKFNGNQILNSENCIYIAAAPNEFEISVFREIYARRVKPVSEVTNSGWLSYINYIPPESFFSFMNPLPKL